MRFNKRAFTLLEVIVSLALMATLLVSVLIAHGRAVRQAASGRAKMEGVIIADRLMEEWVLLDAGVPLNETGQWRENKDFHWQTEKIRISNQLSKVNLKIFKPNLKLERPIVAVEFLLPLENQKK